jgi:hypothetical protein
MHLRQMHLRLPLAMVSTLLIASTAIAAPPDPATQLADGEMPPSQSTPRPPLAGAAYPASQNEVGITSAACPGFPAKTVSNVTLSSAWKAANGSVFENTAVNGRIKVTTSGMTIRCVTAHGGLYTLECQSNDGCTDLTVENVSFRDDAGMTASSSAAIRLVGSTRARISDSYFDGGNDVVKLDASGNVFDHNWFGCVQDSSGSGHLDGLQQKSGSDNTWTNNRFEMKNCPASVNKSGGSGTFFMENGPFNRTRVHGNYFRGSGYTIRMMAKDQNTNITWTNNVIERDSWTLGPMIWRPTSGQCAHWEGNRFDDGAEWKNNAADDSSCALPNN